MNRQNAIDSLRQACDWLIARSRVPCEQIPDGENVYGYRYATWKGSVREYNARKRQWVSFAPIWHTGQAIKALVLAHHVAGDNGFLEAARQSAEFILAAQITDPQNPNCGALLSHEGQADVCNISCGLESLDGLILLGEQTREARYWEAVLRHLEWAERKAYIPNAGLFYDHFAPATGAVVEQPLTVECGFPGRPLLDDGVFLKGFQRTRRSSWRDIFFAVADRLLKQENPPGNWIAFPPCNRSAGTIHPRHAYWWGRPLIMAWQESGDERHLACAKRSANWYLSAMRRDGGFFRNTYTDFSTPSFGQEMSGIFAGCCLWHDLIVSGNGAAYRGAMQTALAFGQSLQFVKVSDPNLKGAVLEVVQPPDGTDACPYLIRDLGTIFYVQALALALRDGLLVA
ncbi:MAG: hypothetical protein HY360_09830 [Verrucomicrobia bacterium]|nr:hypothetical protein [Verrucomicrobiota bacterium]